MESLTNVQIPGSKSVTARALFLAALGDGTSLLHGSLDSDDTQAFRQGLRTLGYRVEETGETWAVEGRTDGPPADSADVYCRDAGTAARFLPALAAIGHGRFRFDASPQMRNRPVGPLTAALRRLGSDLQFEEHEDHLPILIRGAGLRGGRLQLDASVSSQFLTALLMAAPAMDEGLEIQVTDMVSRPYVEMTVQMMRDFGVSVASDQDTFTVPAQRYSAREYRIEPDASTASYFFAAAALTGNSVTVPGLGTGAMQGDIAFVDVLRRMGAEVKMEESRTTVSGTGRLSGITVNMRDISDTMPTLAAIAPYADGPVRIEDVYNTRVKECDRLDACATNLSAMGIRVATGRDWIEIQPGRPGPAVIDCNADHRIAMAFSVAGLRADSLTLDDPQCVKKTFPEFHEVFRDLRNQWRHATGSFQ
ncbi:3-phosphoshikimate 1-carboxyvinyltransferase [Actinoplanes sp. NPDC020271]|uniref:3-phosphoshikimate 1-carboxyvinyltransferase n=1 Tax=Actinoplanes sp. NPDC020271 TaxID=3363896 RepID=UPI0037A7DAA4